MTKSIVGTINVTEYARQCIILPIRVNENSDEVNKNVLRYTTSQRSTGYPRLMELGKIEARMDRKFRKRQKRRHFGHLDVVNKVEGRNFRNFMRARYRARVLIEESAEFVDRVKTQIASDKAKDKARREQEALRAHCNRGSLVEVERSK